uniref:Uncharacterized protein n=1 Tax=Arundo donax TaxID=35708 RepID=A0A0A8Z2A1_ARUDO
MVKHIIFSIWDLNLHAFSGP